MRFLNPFSGGTRSGGSRTRAESGLRSLFGARRSAGRRSPAAHERGHAPERLEERLALTLDVHSVNGGSALLVLLDGQEDAYVTRLADGNLWVSTNSSFNGSSGPGSTDPWVGFETTANQETSVSAGGGIVRSSVNGSTTTIFVTSGREVLHIGGETYPASGASSAITFNVKEFPGDASAQNATYLIAGSLRGSVSTGFGSLAYEMLPQEGGVDLTITLGGGWNTNACDRVIGRVSSTSGNVTLEFFKGDVRVATTLTTSTTHFATYNQNVPGRPQNFTVVSGFNLDDHLMVRLPNDESRVRIQSPVLQSQTGNGFYSFPGVQLTAEYVEINALMTAANVAIGSVADQSLTGTPSVQTRILDFQRPITAGGAYTIAIDGLDANGDSLIQQAERGLMRVGTEGGLGAAGLFSFYATDADAIVESSITATSQSYVFASVQDTQQWQFTTRSADSGFETGRIVGNTVSITFATEGGTTSPVTAENPHVVDLRTAIDSLRITAASEGLEANPFPVRVSIDELDALTLDATPASSAPMTYKAGGSLTTTAEIRTFADLTLESAGGLVANGAIKTVVGDISITAPTVTGGAGIVAGAGLVKRDVNAATTADLGGTFTPAATGGRATIDSSDGSIQLMVDGIAVGNADRVLVKDQLNPNQNGIYVVTSQVRDISTLPVTAATVAPLGGQEVGYATTGGLGNFTYTNLGGVGDSLVLNANTANPNLLLTVDGNTDFSDGELILVKNQGIRAQNGIYQVVTGGAVMVTNQLANVNTATDTTDLDWTTALAAVGGVTTTATTIRANGNAVAPGINGFQLVIDSTLLILNGPQRGVWQVTDAGVAGAGGRPWVLTRRTDVPTLGAIGTGDGVFVISGSRGNLGYVHDGGAFTVQTPWQLVRAADADTSTELVVGTSVRVTGGNTNLGSRYQATAFGLWPNFIWRQANPTNQFESLYFYGETPTLTGFYDDGLGNTQLTIDGVTVANGDIVLIKDEGDVFASHSQDNGLYIVVQDGSTAGTPWILERYDSTPGIDDFFSDVADYLQPGLTYVDVQNGTQSAFDWVIDRGAADIFDVGVAPVTFAVATGWQLERSEDADFADELPIGTLVTVLEGTENGDTGWALATPAPLAIDTTNLVFTQTRKRDAYVATIAAIAGGYDNSAGTLTGSAGSLILEVDGTRFLSSSGDVGRRVFVKDQLDAAENGLYEITAVSDVNRQLADVRAATTASLVATYANNTPGVIASTLTGEGLLPLIDEIVLEVGDRVLVQNQSAAAQNGIYVVTRIGGESGVNQNWVLTRASDLDAVPEFVVGSGVYVAEGAIHGGTGRRLASLTPPTVTVGTTAVTFGAVTPWVLTRTADADTAGKLPYGLYVEVTNGNQNVQTSWALGTTDPIVLGETPLDFYYSTAPFVRDNGDLTIRSNTGNLTVDAIVSATGDTLSLIAGGAAGSIAGSARLSANLLDLRAAGSITANGSANRLVATAGGGIAFENSGAIELESVSTTSGSISVDAGGRITAVAVRAGGSDDTPATPAGQFDIDLVYAPGVSAGIRAVTRAAADRWEQVITGDVEDFTDPTSGQVIDDISIFVDVQNVDGPGGTLGYAVVGTAFLRPNSSLNPAIPHSGEIVIDLADSTDGQLFDILLHELGHSLGFTFTATQLGLTNGASYIGPNALREYRLAFGNSAATVPLENSTGRPGSDLVHWAESVFGNELMTPFIDNQMSLSRVTIGAFDDMGYTVNYAAADSYPLTAAPIQAIAGDGDITLIARSGSIEVVAVTAEEDKVTLQAPDGTITGLSPAAYWLDWTAHASPDRGFYNDYQKLSANLTGRGSIIVENPGAVTLEDVRTADGNILVTAGGELTPVSVVAGGTGTVYLSYTGVGGTVASGTVSSNSSGERILRKEAVRVATTANIALSGLQTIDGVLLRSGDRVLVKNQSSPAANGIYLAASGGWTRAADADTIADLAIGVRVAVAEGTTQRGDYEVSYDVNGSPSVGATALAFSRLKVVSIAEIDPVRLASTANLAGFNGLTELDGVELVDGDRVLVRHQIVPSENGIYTYSSTGGLLTRSAEDLPYGGLVTVVDGSQAGGYHVNFPGTVLAAGTALRFDPVGVVITSSTGIADGDTGTDTVDIIAGTVRLVARDGGIGSAANLLEIAADTLVASATATGLASAATGAGIHLSDTGSLRIANAHATDLVDIRAGGIAGAILAERITTAEAGEIVLAAPGDITVGNLGSTDPDEKTAQITLSAATGFLRDDPDGRHVVADRVRLVSRGFAAFDFATLDDVSVFSIQQTSAGRLIGAFSRADDVTFDSVATTGGDIEMRNDQPGSFVIGTGGLNAGAYNGITLETAGQITRPFAGTAGRIAAGGVVSLVADSEIDVLTSAGGIAARLTNDSVAGTITIDENSDLQIARRSFLDAASGETVSYGIDAGGTGSLITLAVGGMLDGTSSSSGIVRGDEAVVSSRSGMSLQSELVTLSARTTTGDITIYEHDDLLVGATGIDAGSRDVRIVSGSDHADAAERAEIADIFSDISSATSGIISGNLVTLEARRPGEVDVSVDAAAIAGSTVAGSFTVLSQGSLAIGADGIAAGKVVRAVTTAALAGTYNASGRSITANAFGRLPLIDGVELAVGDRVLVRHGSPATMRGVYTVTRLGATNQAWVLTRAADADTADELPTFSFVHVSEGTANAGRNFELTSGTVGSSMTFTLRSTNAPTITLESVTGSITTPATLGVGRGVLSADAVDVVTLGSASLRTDTRSLSVTSETGSVTVREASAVSLDFIHASETSGTGSIDITAGGTLTALDVLAAGTKGNVILATTAGDIVATTAGAVTAPQSVTLDAAGRLTATGSTPPVAAAAAVLTARGTDAANGSAALRALLATSTLTASAPNGSVDITVQSGTKLVLGSPAGGQSQTAISAAGNVSIRGQYVATDVDDDGLDDGNPADFGIVVFSGPQAGNGDTTVRLATALASLPAGSYDGTSLTANANGRLTTIDGVTRLRRGDRVLVTDGAGGESGIYIISSVGSNGTRWVLTRAANADTAAELPTKSYARVLEGVSNIGKVFRFEGTLGDTAFGATEADVRTTITTADVTKTVSFVVSTADGDNRTSGTLGNMLGLAMGNSPTQLQEVLFSTTITGFLRPSQVLPTITAPIVIDGFTRISPTTLAKTTGRVRLAIDGSAITRDGDGSTLGRGAVVNGLVFGAGSSATASKPSGIANLTLSGFSRGSAVVVDGGGGVTVRDTVFGLDYRNRKAPNRTAVTIQSGDRASLAGNTVAFSTGDGMVVTGGDGHVISGNFIGTDSRGSANYANNADGIEVNGATNVAISGNLVARSRGVGVRVTTGSAVIGSATDPAKANRITNGSSYAVYVTKPGVAEIAGNVVTANRYAIRSDQGPAVPRVASAVVNTSRNAITVSGTVAGSGTRFIDLYAAPTKSTDAAVYLGRITVTSGTSFSGTLPIASGLGVREGWKITATNTVEQSGVDDTSSLSAAATASIQSSGGNGGGSSGGTPTTGPGNSRPSSGTGSGSGSTGGGSSGGTSTGGGGRQRRRR